MTITLIGMPAVGKSCMGRAIAKKFNMKLVDGDKVIEHTTGRRLQQIMDEDGLDGFKRIEEDTLLTIKEDNIVCAGFRQNWEKKPCAKPAGNSPV